MILNIDSSKLTEAPYNADRKKSFLIENNDDIDQVVLELRHASPSSFLISGYRGVGKTSFANRIAEQLDKDFIYVNINVAKYNGYPTLIKKAYPRTIYKIRAVRRGGKTHRRKENTKRRVQASV